MSYHSNPELTPLAKTLRKNMTREERRLWYDFLSKLPLSARRQKVIGPYIVDFCIHSAKLIIELDGSQHFEQKGLERDAERDMWLREQGFTVLRYSNMELRRNFEGVCLDILRYLPGVSLPRIE